MIQMTGLLSNGEFSMADTVTKRIADRYISRDGTPPKRREKKLTPKQEDVVLEALRAIAKGRPGKRPFKFLPLTGPAARDKARQALADIMQPVT